MKLSIFKLACVLAGMFLFSCTSGMKAYRQPNQVTNVGGDKNLTEFNYAEVAKNTPVSKVVSSNFNQYRPLNKEELQAIEWDSLSQAQSFAEYTILDFSNGYACNDFGASTTLIKYNGQYYNLAHGDSCVKNIQFNAKENTLSFSTFHYSRAKASPDGKASGARIQHNIYLNANTREPNQVTNVGGGKSSLLDLKLFTAIVEGANMSETSRRVNYTVYNVVCSREDACSYKGEYGKRYKVTGDRARNISTNIGVSQKVAMLTCSNWFDGFNGKELEAEQASAAGLITCESE